MQRGDQVYRITGAKPSASADRQYRQRRYLMSMGIRTACFIMAVIVGGPLSFVFIGFAIVLPYIAVVMANSVTVSKERPSLPPIILTDNRALPTRHPDHEPTPG